MRFPHRKANVTGLSGTGKSAVLSELLARGYHGRGVDEDGYADWVSLVSGTPDHYLRDDPALDFHAWQAAHTWVLSPRRISVLSRAAARLGGPVFLCGTVRRRRERVASVQQGPGPCR